MIKRIIFDLDNTLISGVDFNKPVIKTFEELGLHYTEKELYLIQYCIGKYEYVADVYDKEHMMKFFKIYSNMNLSNEFFDTYFHNLEYLIPERLEDGMEDTLEYLNNKYELCVLTNWFKNTQAKRLENAGILQYFEDVYGGEVFKKPDKNSYLSACNGTKSNQTVMIGDSFEFDYMGAKNAGLKAILYDRKKEHFDLKENERIENIKSLKKVL